MTPLTTSPLTAFCEQYRLEPHRTGPVVSTIAGRHELGFLFRDMGYQRGAEIGVWRGSFSAYLCKTIPGLHLTCVDPWIRYGGYEDPKNQQAGLEDAYVQACAVLEPYGCDIKRMTSKKAAALVPDGSLDFIFVDGNHGKDYVLADLEAWVPKVRSSGIISGHDYELVPRRKWLQVKAAVDEWRQTHNTGPLYVVANDKTPSFFWMVP